MESGLGGGDGQWNHYQYHFGNFNSMETARTQGSLSHRDWHEPNFNDFDGAGDEPGRLWNDGGTCDHPGGFTGYLGCRFSGCLAL